MAVAAEFTILTRPVAVTARFDAQPGNPAQFFPFTLTVSHGERSFTYKTDIVAVADREDALAVLKQTIGWKSGDLFVRQECGGGNMWRCVVEQVFALRGDHLIHIGDQIGGSRSEGPGAFYRDGYFIDVYDRFENNDLTIHAGAPSFAISMKERNGALTVDLARTWAEGRTIYERDRDEIVRVASDSTIDPRDSVGDARESDFAQCNAGALLP